MRFILGLLVGYCIRGKQRLLIATLTAIAVGCFIVLPAIALSLLASVAHKFDDSAHKYKRNLSVSGYR